MKKYGEEILARYKLDDLSNIESEEISADEKDFDEMKEIKYYIFTVFDDGHSVTLLLSLYSFTL